LSFLVTTIPSALLAKAFLQRAKEAGADGLLIVDLPFEEAEELHEECRQLELDLIFLIAPSTSKER